MDPIAPLRRPLSAEWIDAGELLPIVVWTALPDGAIEFVNRRWEEATGGPAASILGAGWTSVIHPGELERVNAVYGGCIAGAVPLRVELRMRCRNMTAFGNGTLSKAQASAATTQQRSANGSNCHRML